MNNAVEKEPNHINQDSKRLSKDTLTYGIAVIIPALIGVISISIYTRIFSLEAYGEYNQIFNTTLLITTLFSQWIQQSIQRYRPLYRSKNKLWEFNANLTNLLAYMFIIIIGFALLTSFFKNSFGRYEGYYWICVLLILTQFSFLVLGALLQSDFKVREYKNYNLLTAILKFVVGILLVFYVSENPISIIYGLVIGQIFLIGFMFKENGLSLRSLRLNPTLQLIEFIKLFVIYGFPMVGWFIGNSILNLADRYMLEAMSSIKDVGVYSANYSLVSASLGLLTTPLLNAAHPIIMNKVDKFSDIEIGKTVTFFTRVYLMISLPLLSFITAFHKEITQLLLGEKFREGSVIIPILFLGLIFWNLGMYGHKGYEIKEKTKIMFIFVLASAVVNIIFNTFLIPLYGYRGAAIATLISMGTYPLLIKICSFKYIAWKINTWSTIRIIISCVLSFFIVFVIKNLFTGYVVIQLIVGFAITLIVYVGVLIILKEINYQELKEKILQKRSSSSSK
ncbi:lipopolysaccharide biosynthesis protein [Priestia megaterium]|uniref:lipopolysaccharide biosynthesis protein n=1 Tax=Priestia megaterium TaxID=1404 RepID=UPI00203CE186|nr:oligosaccharide flippase family protein [Priestia megaterium]MCM3194149.1 oligosaccharide flippase family protein [Priestia megaterium]